MRPPLPEKAAKRRETEILARGLTSAYELEHLARVFFPLAALRGAKGKEGRAVFCTRGALVYARAGRRRLAAALRTPAGRCRLACAPRPPGAGEEGPALCRLLYALLKEETGLRPPWGLLTGVRPLSLWRRRCRTLGEEGAARCLREGCDVSGEKLELLRGIAAVQAPLLARAAPPRYSLYVSVPFCPSRCAYCSFVSQSAGREGRLIGPYLEKLERELAETAHAAAACGLSVHTVYIGGGTPTVLSEAQLDFLLGAVARHFGAETAREYTVEAGRPDCTSPEKLALLKRYGVGRVSINPQSMNDAVLRQIGRAHTAAQLRECYAAAAKTGFGCINMDLIAGLPADSAEGFESSLDEVLALAPGNITLHTLTLKRASDLGRGARAGEQTAACPPAAMLRAAYPRLFAAGYRPYYLYRQKAGLQNLENTGWSLPGLEGLYNVCIMEEVHTVLACGAGAVTKLVKGGGAVIQRLYNHKLPAEYLANFEEVLKRKKGVRLFYAGNLDT